VVGTTGRGPDACRRGCTGEQAREAVRLHEGEWRRSEAMSTLAGSTTIPTLDSALGAALRRWRRRRLVRLLAVAAAVFLLVLVGAAFGVRASGFHETTIGALRLALWITGALLVAAAVGVAFVRRPPRPAI